jgi:hypothetical protein
MIFMQLNYNNWAFVLNYKLSQKSHFSLIWKMNPIKSVLESMTFKTLLEMDLSNLFLKHHTRLSHVLEFIFELMS